MQEFSVGKWDNLSNKVILKGMNYGLLGAGEGIQNFVLIQDKYIGEEKGLLLTTEWLQTDKGEGSADAEKSWLCGHQNQDWFQQQSPTVAGMLNLTTCWEKGGI